MEVNITIVLFELFHGQTGASMNRIWNKWWLAPEHACNLSNAHADFVVPILALWAFLMSSNWADHLDWFFFFHLCESAGKPLAVGVYFITIASVLKDTWIKNSLWFQ